MTDWLHGVRLGLGAAAVCASFRVPTVIGSAFLQPTIGRLLQGEKHQYTLVGLLLNAFALCSGVPLALLSIAVFAHYDKAKDSIGLDASSIIALYRDISGYPEPIRTSIMEILHGYLDEETGPGWSERHRRYPHFPGQGAR